MQLIANDLSCRRGDYPVFAGVDFTISDGEALQLTGNNGSGKSSLLRLLCGLLDPEAGTIDLVGAADDSEIAELCHYLGHDNALKGAMTAFDNLQFWRDTFGRTGLEPYAALKVVGLTRIADLPAAYLSAGQKRRVALARLLVSKRPIWLLDEPTAALDSASETLLGTLVAEHLETGGMAIAATHMTLPFAVTGTIDMSERRPLQEHDPFDGEPASTGREFGA